MDKKMIAAAFDATAKSTRLLARDCEELSARLRLLARDCEELCALLHKEAGAEAKRGGKFKIVPGMQDAPKFTPLSSLETPEGKKK